MINKILKALKAVGIYNISPLDYEQEEKLKEVVLSVTGLSEDDPDFEPFIAKLVDKLGLYDGDPEDNAEVLAWETALQLGVIKPFKGWILKQVNYTDVEKEADSEYFEDDDYPVIESYFEHHGVHIFDDRDDENDILKQQVIDKLTELGYSKGDSVSYSLIIKLCNDVGFEEGTEDILYNFGSEYNLEDDYYDENGLII